MANSNKSSSGVFGLLLSWAAVQQQRQQRQHHRLLSSSFSSVARQQTAKSLGWIAPASSLRTTQTYSSAAGQGGARSVWALSAQNPTFSPFSAVLSPSTTTTTLASMGRQQQYRRSGRGGGRGEPRRNGSSGQSATAAAVMEPIGSDTAEAVPLDIAANATDVAVAEDSSASAFPWPAAGDMHPLLVHNVANTMRFAHMTEIQARTWQAASAGADVLGRARTGTGKTLAFLLPALHQILNQQQQTNQKNDMIQMLILSPTRELAAQIHTQAGQLSLSTGSKSSSLVHQVMFGGASKPKDISLLERNIPHVLVATPGRLRDHLQTTTIGKSNPRPFEHFLSKTQILVLDETDRLLDMGFRREVEDIISYLPDKNRRQTLLFSATVPPEVKAVMSATMRSNFVTVDCIHDTDPMSHTNSQVDQSHVIVPSSTRLVTGTVDILCKLIKDTRAAGEPLKLVVFFNTAHLVGFYAALFNDGLGIPVLELHSRKSQSYRTRTADAFRAASESILFTSDVSARGVDYPGVTDVVQFGIPDSRESYIHRLGRTGRAGKQGEGLLVLSDLEQRFLNQLKGLEVSENKDYQALIDASPSPQIMEKLNPVLNGINSDQDKSLASDARAAYRSMLGFYNGKLAKLGVPGTDRLVAFANDFSRQTGLAELPEIESKTIKKMGLTGVSGLNIVPNISTANSGKGGRGGGSIDQGGGDSRGRGPQSNDPRGGGRGSSFGGRGGGGRGGASSPGPRVGGQYGGRGNDGARRQASTVSNVSPAKRHEPSGSASVAKKPKQEGVEEKALNRSSGATSNNNKNRRRGGGRGSDSNVLP